MPRFRLDIEYDGSLYAGWQRQAGQPSVQAAIEAGDPGLLRRARCRCAAPAAPMPACTPPARSRMSIWRRTGRRDTVRDAVNAHLQAAGERRRVLAAASVADDFDARFSATGRHYLYRIVNRRAPLALERDAPGGCRKPLDAEAMQAAAQRLVGRHDFTTFRSRPCQAKSPVDA